MPRHLLRFLLLEIPASALMVLGLLDRFGGLPWLRQWTGVEPAGWIALGLCFVLSAVAALDFVRGARAVAAAQQAGDRSPGTYSGPR
jgi:hypothetical protein